MAPLRTLAMSPHTQAGANVTLPDLDNSQKIPLDNARKFNAGGLIGSITGLYNHRNSSICVKSDTNGENEVVYSDRTHRI